MILEEIVPLLLILFGIIGNTFSFMVFSRKQFKNMSLNYIFRLMTITDTLTVIQIIHRVLKYNSRDLRLISSFLCKSLDYMTYSLIPVKGWFMVLIAIERFIAIKYNMKYLALKSIKIQLLVAFVILTLNCVENIPVYISSNLRVMNNSLKQCILLEKRMARKILTIDIMNSAIIPFILMLVFNLLMLRVILKSRMRIASYHSQVHAKKNLKNVKFSISTIGFNFFFFLFHFPYSFINSKT